MTSVRGHALSFQQYTASLVQGYVPRYGVDSTCECRAVQAFIYELIVVLVVWSCAKDISLQDFLLCSIPSRPIPFHHP